MIEFSNFVSGIVRDYQRYSGIVGESENIASLFFVLCSKEYKRNLRLHAVLQNLSGAGKSTIADAIVKPFKQFCKDEVIEVSRFTGPALQRFGKFDGKILYHSQAFGDEPQAVLPLLSEGSLGLMISEKEENSSKYVTKVYQLDGMPSFLSTTVIQLNPQLARRVVLRTCDESAIQTREILKSQAAQFQQLNTRSISPFPFVSQIIGKIANSRVDSVIDQVIIPYGNKLETRLPDNLEMRSNFPKFLKLIASVTIAKSVCYRGLYEITDNPEPPLKAWKMKVAIATTEDFNDAYRMAGKSFFEPLSAAETMVLEHLGKQVERNQLNGGEEYSKVRLKELQGGLKFKSRTYLMEIAKSLTDKGLISFEQPEENGHKINEYQFLKSPLEISDLDIGETSPEGWLEGKNYQKLEVEDPLSV